MSSIVIYGDTSGSITLAANTIAGTNTQTLPAATGTVMVSGNIPAFSAYQNTSSIQTISSSSWTKITFDIEEFDTANCFATSRFTPNVAGYYQLQSTVCVNASAATFICTLYKNGAESNKRGVRSSAATASLNATSTSAMLYMNGTTDYVEVYAYQTTGTLSTVDFYTYFSGFLVRTAS